MSQVKRHRWIQLIKMCAMGKNENICSFSFFSYLPIDLIDHGQIIQKLKEQEFSFLPIKHSLIRWAH